MKNRIVFILVFLACYCFGQDSLVVDSPSSVKSVISRLNQITGPDDNPCQDGMDNLREEIEKLKMMNQLLSDSLNSVNDEMAFENSENTPVLHSAVFSRLNEENTIPVFYEMNRSRTVFESYEGLKDLKKACDGANSYLIYIASFADGSGNAAHNEKLVQWRSENVMNYLVSELGLNKENIIVEKGKPANRIEQVEMDFLNRRTDIKFELK